VDEVYDFCKIDRWFLDRVKFLADLFSAPPLSWALGSDGDCVDNGCGGCGGCVAIVWASGVRPSNPNPVDPQTSP